MAKNENNTMEQLEQARQQYAALLTEQGNLDVTRREAFSQDHEARLEAARNGGSVIAAFASRKSKLKEVQEREEALPYEVYAARLLVAELERQNAIEQAPEADAEVERTRKAVRPADEEFEKAKAKHEAVHAAYGTALAIRGSLEAQKAQAESELRSLERQVPRLPTMPEPLAR